MRFLHLADLHFGKSIYGTSLLENGDQPVWVEPPATRYSFSAAC